MSSFNLNVIDLGYGIFLDFDKYDFRGRERVYTFSLSLMNRLSKTGSAIALDREGSTFHQNLNN